MNLTRPVSFAQRTAVEQALRLALVSMCLLASVASAQSSGNYTPPPRTIQDITALLEQIRPDPARTEPAREQLKQPVPQTQDRKTLAEFYLRRGRAAATLGMVGRQISDLRQAEELAKGFDLWNDIAADLAVAEFVGGNYGNALRIREEMARMFPNATFALGSMARVLTEVGDVASARQWYARFENAISSALQTPYGARWNSYRLRALLEQTRGAILNAEGKLGGAELAFRAALSLWEKDWPLQQLRASRGESGNDIWHWNRDYLESRLALNLLGQGRLSEAEAVMRELVRNTLSRIGSHSPDAGNALTTLSRIISEQGRYAEAGVIAQAAVNSFEKSGVTSASHLYFDARRAYGAALVAERKWNEALAEYEKIAVEAKADPALAERVAVGDLNWGLALIKTGRASEAVPLLDTLEKQTSERLTDAAYETAQARGFLALALAASHQRERALSEFRRAVPVLLDKFHDASGVEEGKILRAMRFTIILEAYINLLADLQGKQTSMPGLDLFAESFRIADVARGSNVQRALAASAARAAISDPRLAQIARQEQDAQVRLGILSDLLSRLVSAPPDQQLPKIIADIRKEIETLRIERVNMKQAIEQRFPDYANLIDPKPATIERARAALKPGEALISIYVAEDKTYVWAIPKDGAPAFGVAPLGEKEIAETVAQLRKALDVGDATLDSFPKFNVAGSYKLYRELLAPVESGWKGATSLLIVPHRALGQLSFAVLVTAPTALAADKEVRFESYRAVPWLARKAAITQLPSVNTLVTLRSLAASSAPRREFVGFGDPYFSKAQQAQAANESKIRLASRGLRLRNLTIEKVALPAAVTPTVDQQGMTTRAPAVANSSTLAQLARLPDTADEIREIALALKADPDKDVFLGARANEKNVKTTDLSNRKVIAFATHGLVPGDLNGLEQPALALTAPDVAGIDGDGLLTMDEILGLKLNADWVVLSACNTASGEGAGAEAVSGLGRAFFYAGARALLVSNWPVETVSARRLTTDLFKRQAENPNLTRAEALRQTMLGLIDGTGAQDAAGKLSFSYAHPLFWAPFSLVGDGGR